VWQDYWLPQVRDCGSLAGTSCSEDKETEGAMTVPTPSYRWVKLGTGAIVGFLLLAGFGNRIPYAWVPMLGLWGVGVFAMAMHFRDGYRFFRDRRQTPK
jgi:hypothetical protein